MKTIKHFIAILLCISLCLSLTQAQPAPDKRQDAQTTNTIAQDVLIIIQQEQVRFTSQKAVAEMQLQIFDQAGQVVYDSGVVTGPELTWVLRQADGEAVKSGLYAYTLSIKEVGKEAGAETARLRRGHFIVDRAKERDGQTDRLWITSQNEDGVGTELTVARNEGETVAGTSVTSEQRSVKAGEKAQIKESESKARSEETASKTAAAAANGTVNRVAKFISSTDLGNSSITDQNGAVSVAANLKAIQGAGTDITVQTTGGTNAYAQFRAQTPSQQWIWGTSQNYNGNQFYLIDNTYNRFRMTIQPNGGEIMFPNTSSNHLVVQTSGGTNSWAQFRVQTPNQRWAIGASQNFNGDQLYFYDDVRSQIRMATAIPGLENLASIVCSEDAR